MSIYPDTSGLLPSLAIGIDEGISPHTEKDWAQRKSEWVIAGLRVNHLKYDPSHSLIHASRITTGEMWVKFMDGDFLEAFLKCYKLHWPDNLITEDYVSCFPPLLLEFVFNHIKVQS